MNQKFLKLVSSDVKVGSTKIWSVLIVSVLTSANVTGNKLKDNISNEKLFLHLNYL